ncbi:Gfo/Idh/MocA family protein [Paenibacillus arenilitoris]|uniref:Gfo/Idh/MocA family oxidoreductase n=1 Tax=Paenibacillus arenilitoris TaxID=2772299 RepID=A0A927CJQ2_9BACL|nr:Gfo/Idh/MocA family oxidoreductase [Paenibacillus arenilitoris]MBD2868725.1 Gfo/Idh/MocA family oxidoreductase [Paenibacillus arenilitoris]
MNDIRIGMIGLDTSHAVIFARLLHDRDDPHHIPGGRITAAYPGGSPDFPLSIGRVAGYTEELRAKHGVRIVDSPEEVAERCDAIMLESADGRVHAEQFARIAPYGKPVFIDKPLALTAADADEIWRLALRYRVPLMSGSSLRFADELQAELRRPDGGAILGADVYGPMSVQPTQRHYFWYGIHSAEMLYAAMGRGCEEVHAFSSEGHELIAGKWKDGRIGTIRGGRSGSSAFGARVHRETGTSVVEVGSGPRPYYASLLEKVIAMFAGGRAEPDMEETGELIRFLEAAEESRMSGISVKLNPGRRVAWT